MNVDLPRNLYKYQTLSGTFNQLIDEGGERRRKNGFDALEEILVTGQIYYSKPYYFNDPFELEGIRLRLSEREKERITNRTIRIMRRARPAALSALQASELVRKEASIKMDEAEEQKERTKDSILYRTGFICLSATVNEKLMWSHYADAHRGLCLRLKCQKDPFYEEDGKGRIMRVEYGDEILSYELKIGEDNEEVLRKASRKAACWSSEQEYRVFRVPSKPKANDAFGVHPFNSELVDAIYLGLRIPDEHKEKVLDIVGSIDRDIVVYESVRNADRLELEFNRLH